jgi:putative oxygen-independent coproporphyrinogen III oxidase
VRHDAGAPFGVYLHIPFCSRRCDYCAFATWDDRPGLVPSYLEALTGEVEAAVAGGLAPATSVFFGGGTPSLVPAGALVALVGRLPLASGAEVTVECNPETVTPEMLDAYRAGGVTRLSLGVQSMAPAVLESLGRQHDPGSVHRAVAMIRARGFESFNLDIIYGAAAESLDDWRRTVDEVLALEPPHISAYGLTVEPGTPLADQPDRHPDDDDEADKYLLADALFEQAGLSWYEVSNWSRPGHRCRHNELYWAQGDYRGFGCAAHSHRRGRRWWNVRTPERYLARLGAGSSPEGGAEELDPDARVVEALQLALRTRRGVPVAALPSATDPDALPPGLTRHVDGRAVLTLDGRLLANEVALRLRPPATAGR